MNASQYFDMACRYHAREDYKEAEKHFRKALELEPENPQYNEFLGLCLFEQDEFEQAEKYFRKALKSHSGNRGHLYNNLALCLFNQGRLRQAEEAFVNAIDEIGADDQLYFNLGLCLFDQDEFERAEEQFQKALSLTPNDPKYSEVLSIVSEKRGNISDALRHANVALAKARQCNNEDMIERMRERALDLEVKVASAEYEPCQAAEETAVRDIRVPDFLPENL